MLKSEEGLVDRAGKFNHSMSLDAERCEALEFVPSGIVVHQAGRAVTDTQPYKKKHVSYCSCPVCVAVRAVVRSE